MNCYHFYFLRDKKKILKNQALFVLTLDPEKRSLPEPNQNMVNFNQLMSFAISLGPNYTICFSRKNKNGDINAEILANSQIVYAIKIFTNSSQAQIRLVKKDNIPDPIEPEGFKINPKYSFHPIQRNVTIQEEQEMLQKQTLYSQLGPRSTAVLLGQKIFHIEKRNQLLIDSMARLSFKNDPRQFNKDQFSFINEYPGHWEFHHTVNPIEMIKIGDKYIHSFTYLVDEFRDIISRAQCIEIDASFYVMHPHVFTIPLAIVANESIPLGLSVGPTESSLLFEQFYTFIKSVDDDAYEKLKVIPVLSDEGSAIEKFCNDNKIRQFLCYTHLIRKFGANTQLGGIVKGLLFQKSPEDFKRAWQILKPQIVELLTNNQKHIK